MNTNDNDNANNSANNSAREKSARGIKKSVEEMELVKNMLRKYLYNSDGEYSEYGEKTQASEEILEKFLDESCKILRSNNPNKYATYKNEDLMSISTIKDYIKDVKKKKGEENKLIATKKDIKKLAKDEIRSIDIIRYPYEKHKGLDENKKNKYKEFYWYKVIIRFNQADFIYKEKLCDLLFYQFDEENKIKFIENHYGAIVINCTSINKCKAIKNLLNSK